MSGWYNVGKQDLFARAIPAEADLYVVGVNDGYTFDATHVDFASFGAHVILPEKILVNPTFTNGILDADDLKWIAAGAGVTDLSLTLTAVIFYFKLGDVGTLLAYLDSVHAGLPTLLTGVNVTAIWDSRGILKL